MRRAVVLDIEGTVSPAAFVHERLFPYSRELIPQWVRRPDPAVTALVAETLELAGRPDGDADEAARILRGWVDADRKEPPLKALQGLIWEHGFSCGELTAYVYPDVPGSLRRWHTAGVELYVYSSGSELAQRLWFAHTGHGDLNTLLSGYFDLHSAGPKREPASYTAIRTRLGLRPQELLFLSDTAAELDAARRDGWETTQVVRAGEPTAAAPGHRSAADFDAVTLPGGS